MIPAYNAARSIADALQSVFKQTKPPAEIIVVNDGSLDGTAMVLKGYGHSIHTVHQANAGASAARNRGITESQGDWIAFLDADDRWYPQKLERQLELLTAYPEISWLAGKYDNAKHGRPTEAQPTQTSSVVWGDVVKDALAFMGDGGSIWTGMVMVRREVLQQVGVFDDAQRTSHDLDLWLRIAERYPTVGWTHHSLAAYSRTETGLTTTSVTSSDETLIKLFYRAVEVAERLPPHRRRYLYRFLSRHGNRLLRDFVASDQPEQATLLLRQLQATGVRIPYSTRIAMRLPPFVLPIYRQIAAITRGQRAMVLRTL